MAVEYTTCCTPAYALVALLLLLLSLGSILSGFCPLRIPTAACVWLPLILFHAYQPALLLLLL
jgi:hypothetical protein